MKCLLCDKEMRAYQNGPGCCGILYELYNDIWVAERWILGYKLIYNYLEDNTIVYYIRGLNSYYHDDDIFLQKNGVKWFKQSDKEIKDYINNLLILK